MNGPLSQADAEAEFALAPAEHSPGNSNFGGKGAPLELDQLKKIAGIVDRKMYCHRSVLESELGWFWENPRRFPAGGLIKSLGNNQG